MVSELMVRWRLVGSPGYCVYRFVAFLHDAGVDRGPDGDVLPVVVFDQVGHLHTDKGGSQMRRVNMLG